MEKQNNWSVGLTDSCIFKICFYYLSSFYSWFIV